MAEGATQKEGIVIEFSTETAKFDKSINTLNAALKTLKTEFSSLNRNLKKNPNDVKTLEKEYRNLGEQIKVTRDKLEMYRKTQEDLSNEVGKGNQMTEAQAKKWLDNEKHIIELTNSLEGLKNRYKATGDTIDRLTSTLYAQEQALNKASEHYKTLAKDAEAVGKSMEKVSKVAMGISSATVAGIGASVKKAVDFESALTGVYKTIDETTTTTYKDIEDGIRKMALQLPSSASEIAAVAEMAGQLGVTADDVLKFTKVMIDLGNATNLNATDGAAQVAQFYNIMGEDLSTIDQFGSAVTDLGNNAATTEENIVYMAKALAGTGAQLDLTIPDVLGLATALSSAGLSAERGGSSISTILRKIDVDAKTVTDDGTERLKTWGSLIGMTGEEFRSLWNNDTMTAINEVIRGLSQADEVSESLYTVLDDVDISSIRQVDTVTRLANSYENFNRYVGLANEAYEENTALATEVNRRYETTASQFEILKNSVSELGITLGDWLLPKLNEWIDKGKDIVQNITEWASENKGLVEGIAGFASALGPITVALTGGVKLYGKYASGMAKLTKYAAGGTGVISKLALALAGGGGAVGLAVGAGLAVAAVGGLAYAIYNATKETDPFAQSLEKASEAFDDARERADEHFSSMEREIDVARRLAERYDELQKSYSDTYQTSEDLAEKKAEQAEIIRKLNELVGEEAYSFNEETGALELYGQKVDSVAESYDNLAQKIKTNAWLEANKQALTEAYQLQDELSGKTMEIADNYAKAMEGFVLADGSNSPILETVKAVAEGTKTMEDLAKEAGSMSGAIDLMNAYNTAGQELATSLQELNEAQAKNNEFIELYNKILEASPEEAAELIRQNALLKSSFDDMSGSLENTLQGLEIQKQQMMDSGADDTELANIQAQIDAVQRKIEENNIAKENALTNQQEIADDANEKTESTTQTYIDLTSGAADTVLEKFSTTNAAIEADGVAHIEAIKLQWEAWQPSTKYVNIVAQFDGASAIGGGYGGSGGHGGSGGFQSGGYTVNMNTSINMNGVPTQEQARSVANSLVDMVNQELGRRLKYSAG